MLDLDPASPKKGHSGDSAPIFGHVYCGQTAGCIRIPLGAEVGLGPGHCVRWGPAPLPQKRGTAPDFRPMSIVAKRSPISATAEILLTHGRGRRLEQSVTFLRIENVLIRVFLPFLYFHFPIRVNVSGTHEDSVATRCGSVSSTNGQSCLGTGTGAPLAARPSNDGPAVHGRLRVMWLYLRLSPAARRRRRRRRRIMTTIRDETACDVTTLHMTSAAIITRVQSRRPYNLPRVVRRHSANGLFSFPKENKRDEAVSPGTSFLLKIIH